VNQENERVIATTMATSAIMGPIIPKIPGNFLEGNLSLAAMPLVETILLFSSRYDFPTLMKFKTSQSFNRLEVNSFEEPLCQKYQIVRIVEQKYILSE
jgi:hypothetical protein